jgi:hypothetical protein
MKKRTKKIKQTQLTRRASLSVYVDSAETSRSSRYTRVSLAICSCYTTSVDQLLARSAFATNLILLPTLTSWIRSEVNLLQFFRLLYFLWLPCQYYFANIEYDNAITDSCDEWQVMFDN